MAYAQIDWHDFVVVETVDYQPNEMGHFPTPTTPDEVGARVLMQERLDNEPEAGDEEAEEEPEGAEEKEEPQKVKVSAPKDDDVEMELSDKEDGAEVGFVVVAFSVLSFVSFDLGRQSKV